MVKKIEKFILKQRPWCEMPDERGNPMHMVKATRLLQVRRKGYSFTVAACAACANYLRKEENSTGRDR
jgi:hypothetical protein